MHQFASLRLSLFVFHLILQVNVSPESIVKFCFYFNSNYMMLTTDFSCTCWLNALSCANMSDLDVSQSVHVDKKELSKELTTCWVWRALGKIGFVCTSLGIYILMKQFALRPTRCLLKEQ